MDTIISLRRSDIIVSAVLGELIFLSLVPVNATLHFFQKLHLDKVPVPLFFWWFALVLPIATVSGYLILFWISKRFPVMLQVARYGLIGVFNTILNLAIINILILQTGIASGYTADLFAVISFVIVVTNSFFWNKYWTFGGGQEQKTTEEYIQFFAVSISGALINLGIFHFIVNIIGPREGIDPKVWANIALAIGIPVSFIWNFFGYRLFVFKSKTDSMR